MKKPVQIGLDIGSVSVKMAVLLPETDTRSSELIATGEFSRTGEFLLSKYFRHQGAPQKAARKLLENLSDIIPESECRVIVTGSGAKTAAARWGYQTVNEFRAMALAMGRLYPDVTTVFELGGERSRYMKLEPGSGRILDYEMNGECAAGTGAFFDQQAGRLKMPVEAAGEEIVRCDRCANIAGRCSVFAKSDMIHAQQRGYTPPEVLKGLSRAVVRNFKGSITKGKSIEPRTALIGGVAANDGVAEAFRDLFEFTDGEFVIPGEHAYMSAIGAAMSAESSQVHSHRAVLKETKHPTERPLSMKNVTLLRDKVKAYVFPGHNVDAWLGIDIGSVSTNLALIDDKGDLIHGIYVMTDGRPVEVVTEALKSMQAAAGGHVLIKGAGTTGSGRELIGILTGADVIKDEITAHKTGADHVARRFVGRRVDTIFEIGGQDSKFISIEEDGTVVDFALNEACAAGTGSFLEEQAVRMGISIKEEFSKLALSSDKPLKLGERCTVFMEKEVLPYMQAGISKTDISAGLAYAVVLNYLNRVVKKRKIGDTIFLQGGTAYNDSVAAAFSTILGKEIIVPPHNGIMGAIGAALLAQAGGKETTTFRGWDLDRVDSSLREFTCTACDNHCIIQEFTVAGEKSYWGDRCSDRYRKRAKSSKTASIPDLSALRDERLIAAGPSGTKAERGTVGIARALHFYHRHPFWKTYFKSLGFETVLSAPTKQKLVDAGIEATVAEPCFPIQAAHGHLLDLMEKDADILFIPNLVTEEDNTNSVNSYVCPWTQTFPLVVKHTPAFEKIHDRILMPNIQFRMGEDFVASRLQGEMKKYGVKSSENRKAVRIAYEAYRDFETWISRKGAEAVRKIEKERIPSLVLLGRPYNLYDPGLNLNVPSKLRELYGMNVIPMDFLPLESVNIHEVHTHMFWNFGRKILQAARYCKDKDYLQMIFLSNFKCGPDSYIRHYVADAADKPYLFLQLDSHANDAGIMTRIEAFLESKDML